MTTQDVVQSVELLCILHGQHVLYVLHDTDGLGVTTRVATDGTQLAVADIVADATMPHLLFHLGDGLCQRKHFVGVTAQQVEYQP